MTFDYGYRDSTNARRDGVIAASSRDEAYRLLKAQGIKPIYVTPAKGFGNRLLALGKRGFAIAALGVLCCALAAVAFAVLRNARDSRARQLAEATAPLTRRQIYGDPALMERLQLENYASLFAAEGDRVLAHFAQPALTDRFVSSLRRDPSARAAAVRALVALCAPSGATGVPPVGGVPPGATGVSPVGGVPSGATGVPPVGGVPSGATGVSPVGVVPPGATGVSPVARERSELLRIVRWMRGEFSDYLANGLGTPETYLARLLERQQYEAEFYARAKRELEGEKDLAVWEKRNAELRAIGAPTLAMPEE